MLKKYLLSTWAVASLMLLLVLVRFSDPFLLELARVKSFDYMQRIEAVEPNEDIVLVDIGEKSIEKYGQWPWSRNILADIVNRLYASGAKAVVLPIIFSEEDRFKRDEDLAKALSRGPSIIAQAATAQNNKPSGALRGISIVGADPRPFLFEWGGALAPLDRFARAAAGVGMVATAPEIDGVARKVPHVIYIGGQLYPSLSLETLRVLGNQQSYQMKSGVNGVEAVRIPGFSTIATDRNARVFVKFNNDFARVEAVDNLAVAKDKIAIVGLTAEGLAGQYTTPIGIRASHDLQAHALSTMISGKNLIRPDFADLTEILFFVAIGAVMLFLVPRAGLALTIPVYAGYCAIAVAASYISFHYFNYLLDASFAVAAGALIYGYLLFNKFAKELTLKLQIKKQFGSYLSPDMVEQLQKNPDLLKLGGDSRELSIMFTDVRGFTSISEHYGADVQGLTKIMNRYMTAMTAKIIENRGTLDKYIGDAQMAFWNAPLDDPNHAKNAVRTALQMMGSLDEFNKQIAAEGVPAFGMGLGINTGVVVVGNMGSDQRFDYTCLGDGVNLASRLEGQSKPYGVKIVLGSRTAELVQDEYFLLELDCIAVKGKKQGVNIFTVLVPEADTQLLEWHRVKHCHNEMLSQYRAQNWTRAVELCNDLTGEFGGQMDHYYEAILERIKELQDADLPKDWDGVFRATSK